MRATGQPICLHAAGGHTAHAMQDCCSTRASNTAPTVDRRAHFLPLLLLLPCAHMASMSQPRQSRGWLRSSNAPLWLRLSLWVLVHFVASANPAVAIRLQIAFCSPTDTDSSSHIIHHAAFVLQASHHFARHPDVSPPTLHHRIRYWPNSQTMAPCVLLGYAELQATSLPSMVPMPTQIVAGRSLRPPWGTAESLPVFWPSLIGPRLQNEIRRML